MLKRLIFAAAIFAICATGLGYLWAVRHSAIAAIDPPGPDSFDPGLVAKGAMLAGIGNCSACHTNSGGAEYAGGVPTQTPFGTVFSTNITPDPRHGIGNWSQDAFARAMRQGIDRNGEYLYPVFPYDHLTLTSDDDIAALYAYIMTRSPADTPARDNQLVFPYDQRILLAGWQALFLKDARFEPDPEQSESWNRGAYLVEGLGHCAACHTPRNLLGGPVGGAKFAGAELAGGWFAPAMDHSTPAVVPWSRDAIVNYLLDGWDRDHGIAGGPMTKVVDNLSVHLSEDDAYAMADYLLTFLPSDDVDPAELRTQGRAVSLTSGQLDAAQIGRVADHPMLALGQQVFAGSCSNCHREGADTVPLALTTSVNIPHSGNFLAVTRYGITPPAGAMAKSMPAFPALTRDELRAVAHFSRWQFTDRPAWDDLEAALDAVLGASD